MNLPYDEAKKKLTSTKGIGPKTADVFSMAIKGMCVRETPDSGYIIVETLYPQLSYGDVYILKSDSLEDILWARTYEKMNVDEWGSSVQVTRDGGYIIVGGKGGAVRDLYLLKVDSLGDTLCTRTYGDEGDEWGACIEPTNDGNYIIAGGTHSYDAGYSDIRLLKVNPSGDTSESIPLEGQVMNGVILSNRSSIWLHYYRMYRIFWRWR